MCTFPTFSIMIDEVFLYFALEYNYVDFVTVTTLVEIYLYNTQVFKNFKLHYPHITLNSCGTHYMA